MIEHDRDQVLEIHPRINELSRKTDYATKVIASNVDMLVITCAIEPEPSLELIDSYIIAAENMSAAALILINKIDLNDKCGVAEKIENKYKNLPYDIIKTSIMIQKSLNLLIKHLNNRTCVFVGQSGVGKSTLINSLIPSAGIETQNISGNIRKGKHTTSATALYDLPLGGELIDSPGVRNFNFPKLDSKMVLKGFREINELNNKCKYNNCIHINEPGCKIIEAVGQARINKDRYESFKKLIKQYT